MATEPEVEVQYVIDWEGRDCSGLYTSASKDEFASAGQIMVMPARKLTMPTKLDANLKWKIRVDVKIQFVRPELGSYVYCPKNKHMYLALKTPKNTQLQVPIMPIPEKATWNICDICDICD